MENLATKNIHQESDTSVEEKDFYDRQLRLWGHETQRRLCRSLVVLIGVDNVSLEIAKNLVLSGVSLTFVSGDTFSENNNCENLDSMMLKLNPSPYMGEFAFNDEAVKEAVDRVRKMNSFVSVGLSTFSEFYKSLDCDKDAWIWDAIISNTRTPLIMKLSKFCRVNNKGFFLHGSFGMVAIAFQDWGLRCPQRNSEFVFDFPSFEDFLKVSPGDLAAGNKELKRNKKVHPSLLIGHWLMNFELAETKAQNWAQTLFEKYKFNDSEIEDLKNLSKNSGICFPLTAAILGGFVAREASKYLLKEFSQPTNFFVFDGRAPKGMVFNFNIVRSSNGLKNKSMDLNFVNGNISSA